MESQELSSKIEEAVALYVKDDTPGMALLIGEKGKIVYEGGFGLSDMEARIPMTTDKAFIIASVSKQFTTMAIMMLKERGLLDYEDTIERFFPDFPPYTKKVTIRNLMTHTSGIKEYFDDDFCKIANQMGDAMTQDTILEMIKGFGDLEFEPDTNFSYCNSAYVMLGSIIEQVSKKTFAEFLKENIFDPLGMNNTVVGVSPNQKVANLTPGYMLTENGQFKRTPFDMAAIGWADGNLISTVEDLFIWHNALYTEKLVKKETFKEAITSHVLKDGSKTGYGCGWFLNNRRGLKETWHTGGTVGYISRFSRFIDEDVAIIMLTNYEGIKRDDVFGKIVDIYLEDRLQPINFIELDEDKLAEKAGLYKEDDSYCKVIYDSKLQKLKIDCDVSRLKGVFTITPVEEMLFRLDTPADYYIEFISQNGNISEMKMIFNGLPVKLKKE
jgi:CubicO group peptidase (beta-lactamase class C family)